MARLTARKIKAWLLAVGASEEQAEILAAVAMGESGGNTDAHALTSREDSWGLFQVNRYAWPDYTEECLRAPACSAKAALAIAATPRGYGHWTQYTNGGYRRFLPVGPHDPLTQEEVASAGTVGTAVAPEPGLGLPGGKGPLGIDLPPLPTPDELKRAAVAAAVIAVAGIVGGLALWVIFQGSIASAGKALLDEAGELKGKVTGGG